MVFEELIKVQLTEVIRQIVKELTDLKPPEFFTPEEISQITKVDEETVRRWCRKGDLPYTRFGKFMRIKPHDFKAFCERRAINRLAA